MPGSTIPNAPGGEKTTPLSTDKIALSGSQFAQLANLYKALAASPAAGKFLEGDGSYSAVADTDLSVTDVITNNATIALHGFLKKLSNVSTEFMNGAGNWATPAGLLGYTLLAHSSLLASPLDATTYFFGSQPSQAMSTTEAFCRVFFPFAGTVTRVDIAVRNTGTLGTGETSTAYLRYDATTDNILSSALVTNSTINYYAATGLAIPVVAGHFFEIKWVTPTWGTNPSNISMTFTVYVE